MAKFTVYVKRLREETYDLPDEVLHAFLCRVFGWVKTQTTAQDLYRDSSNGQLADAFMRSLEEREKADGESRSTD